MITQSVNKADSNRATTIAANGHELNDSVTSSTAYNNQSMFERFQRMKRRMGGVSTPSGNGVAPGAIEAKDVLNGSALHSSLEDALLNDEAASQTKQLGANIANAQQVSQREI